MKKKDEKMGQNGIEEIQILLSKDEIRSDEFQRVICITLQRLHTRQGLLYEKMEESVRGSVTCRAEVDKKRKELEDACEVRLTKLEIQAAKIDTKNKVSYFIAQAGPMTLLLVLWILKEIVLKR